MYATSEEEVAAWFAALHGAINDFALLRLAAEALEAAQQSASVSAGGSARQTDSLLGVR